MNPAPRFWTRRDVAAFAVPGLIALGVYVFSLPPSVTMEDAGELVVAADYLGVPHPPGYPLWTVLAWAFQWVFHAVEFRGYPNPAWAVSLMSAVFGSAACGLVSVCTARLIRLLPSDTSSPRTSVFAGLTARLAGAGTALGLCSVLQTAPEPGRLLINIVSTLFLLALILQGLSPEDRRTALHRTLPGLHSLGHGFWGACIGSVIYLSVWSWLLIPSLALLLPLAVAGVLGVLLVSMLLQAGLNRAAISASLATDVQGSGLDVMTGTASGLLLAFTPLMYSQSVIPEVYSLNAFFIALLLLLVLGYLQHPSPGRILLIGFLFALGLTNHQSLLFLVFFLVAGVAAARQRALLKDGLFLMGLGALGFTLLKARQYHGLDDASATIWFLLLAGWIGLLLGGIAFTRGGLFTTWRTLAGLILLGILGLSFHLYMPIASEQNPPMNWGNARTWEGFRHALSRGQYASFSVADNARKIGETMSTPVDPSWTAEANAAELNHSFARRTLFLNMLGAYLHDPGWKTSIASQFSLQIPDGEADPTGQKPPPGERNMPFALWGLLPLLMFGAFPARLRGWFVSSMVAMFFLTVVFLIIQWPELNQNDLWIKRVQYVQAHVLFAVWMGLGAGLTLLLLYAFLPRKLTLWTGALPLCVLFAAFPLWKEHHDPRHLEHLGASNLRGHDFGWQFGFYQLRGANGILLDELAHHRDPDVLFNDWARTHLQRFDAVSEQVLLVLEAAGETRMPRSEFRKTILAGFRLSEEEQRWVEEAGMLAAFRALTPEEQAASLVHLHRPLPDWDYPAEMDPDAILFGGTDPGRFVPTYMVFSAGVRPDVSVITQTALADGTYQETLRDLYGDEILLPDFLDANQAFLDYANDLRIFYPALYAQVMGVGESMSVSGVSEVNRINAKLTRQIVERNRHAHSFYFEQAIRMPWMTQHLRPHGLVFHLEPDPVELTALEIRKSREFWDWMEERLLAPDPDGGRNRYQRDLPVRKTFSKLRMAQAWNFYERGRTAAAVQAMDQALRLYPANPEAAFRAGDFYMRRGNFARAQEILADYAPHDPTNRQLVSFARSLQTLEELDEERVQLEKDLLLRPTGNTALKLLQIYSSFRQEDRVEEMAELILRLPNLHPDFYPNLAARMQQEENADLYRRAVEAWAEKDPDNPQPFIDLAAIALYDSDYPAMIGHLVRAVQLSPDTARDRIAQDPRFLDIRHWQQFQRLARIFHE